ncbi:MAG: DUF47 family protein [Actinomycetes bacterium]
MTPSFTRWFLPDSPDLLEMLNEQTEITSEGMTAFRRWAAGEAACGDDVREAEHTADDAKAKLIDSVREAFTTPLEPEDLFELSRGLDEVINGAKNTVREAEVMQIEPDQAMADMAVLLSEGVNHLRLAFQGLPKNHGEAAAEAAAAIKAQRRLERVYRQAMSTLIDGDDLRRVVGYQELYRRMTRISEQLVGVADRIGYSVVKES